MKIIAITLGLVFVLSVFAVPIGMTGETEKKPSSSMVMEEMGEMMEKTPASEKGYVQITINRTTGALDSIKFLDAKGNEEKPETERKVSFPLEINAEVKVLDSIIWFLKNPTCVWHDSREICG